jgi:hypothetical protein
MCCSPKKIIAEVTSSSAPRSTWKRGCAARKRPLGANASHSAMTTAWKA